MESYLELVLFHDKPEKFKTAVKDEGYFGGCHWSNCCLHTLYTRSLGSSCKLTWYSFSVHDWRLCSPSVLFTLSSYLTLLHCVTYHRCCVKSNLTKASVLAFMLSGCQKKATIIQKALALKCYIFICRVLHLSRGIWFVVFMNTPYDGGRSG